MEQLTDYIAAVAAESGPLYQRHSFEEDLFVYLYAPSVQALGSYLRTAKAPKGYSFENWGEEAELYVDTPELLADASADIIRSLLHFHFRYEALDPGHLASLMDSGYFSRLIQKAFTTL